jgi:hypothetical protein
MTDRTKFKEALQLFNKKAAEVLNSSMLEELSNHGTRISFYDDGKIKKKHGPSADQIKAFVLDFRFFIQVKERSSFSSLAKLYQNALVDEWIKKNFESAWNYIQTYLNAPSLDKDYKGKRITNHKLLDIFLYGGLAHADKSKEDLFNNWMSDPVFAAYLQHEFVWVLSGLCWVIRYIRDLNVEALKQLG